MTPEELDQLWGAVRERHANAGGPGIKAPAQGAATSVLVATSPLLTGIGGRYFEDCNEAHRLPREFSVETAVAGVASYALDPDNAARLWNVFASLTG
jgi:hypothetical protein